MAKKERNRGSVDRARAKRGSAGDMSAEEFDAALARMRTAASFDAERTTRRASRNRRKRLFAPSDAPPRERKRSCSFRVVAPYDESPPV
jgi:hypothetical protein